MKQVWITRNGPPEVLELKETNDPQVEPGKLKIRVHSAGINFADIMARLGLYPDCPPLPVVVGYEIAGHVEEIGEGVAGFKKGDAVIGLCPFGGYSDCVVLSASGVFALPAGWSLSEGAALPVNYLTAYQLLFASGAIQEGESVFVHSAGGGVGMAALQLCKIAGARAFGTASPGKHAFLKAQGYEDVYAYDEDIVAKIKSATGGKGVNLVLDPVGGKSWATGMRLLSPTGRLMVYGFSGAVSGKKRNPLVAFRQVLQIPWKKTNPLALINSNKGIVGVNLGHLWNRQDLVRGWAVQLLEWAAQGKIKPHVDKTFSWEDAASAHHYIQDRKNTGKVLLGSV